MGGEWRTARIEEVAERVAMGPFGSSIKVETFVPDGVPIISGQHLHGFKVDDRVGYNFITEEHAERLKNANVQRKDVIFTHAGNIGQVAFVPDNSKYDRYVISQRQFYLRPNTTKVLPEYIVAFFKTPEGQHKLLANTSQVGVPSIAQPVTYLRSLVIPLPPLPEQCAIAHILGTLDDKIELNRRMNQTLEEMARAIFKSWFVDYDPVRDKAAIRREHPDWSNAQVSRAACPTLKPEIAELFPDEFENSELGEIPKGWRASQVGHHFRLTMGQSPPGSTYNEIGEGIPFYQGRSDFGFRYPTRRVYCTVPTRFAEPGDTLVSVRAPVGDINIAVERCAIGRGVAAIRHESGSRSFTYYTMHQLAEHFLKFEAEGSVFGCINKADFERLPFFMPLPEVLATFDRVVSPLDDRVEIAERQTADLAALRDTLLPKLISGKLRVKDAERFLKKRGL